MSKMVQTMYEDTHRVYETAIQGGAVSITSHVSPRDACYAGHYVNGYLISTS